MDSIPTLPTSRSSLLEVPPLVRRLQTKGPIHRVRTAVGDEGWLVTGHAELRELMGDSRMGRSHPDPESASRVSESALIGGAADNFDTEPEDAAKLRSRLQPLFSAKRMRLLRGHVDDLVTELLDTMEKQGSPADLHQALALPLPILVICELLGVPYADRADFREWSQQAGTVSDRAQSYAGIQKLFGYIHGLIERKRREPGEDVLSALCQAEDGTIPDEEIARLGAVLLFAGHETTVTRIGYGTVLLLANPDQRDLLLTDPDLLSKAIEEILRSQSKGGGTLPRYARTDIEIGGVVIKSGDLVILDTGAGNHDVGVFTDPDRFDVSRKGNTHLGFGHGMHYCIGAPLARIELQAVFGQLLPRFPKLRLDVGLDRLEFDDDQLTKGLKALPVAW